ncbi:uncharacterized protein Hap1MRO34_013255 isoform 1-T1 [Clarias gariepinus]
MQFKKKKTGKSHLPGHWNMSVLADFKGAPLQLGGIDCGVFMLMDSAAMKNILLACKWVEENQHQFAGKIELPKILKMKEEDVLLAITMRDLFLNTMFYEGERDKEKI